MRKVKVLQKFLNWLIKLDDFRNILLVCRIFKAFKFMKLRPFVKAIETCSTMGTMEIIPEIKQKIFYLNISIYSVVYSVDL